MVTLCRIQLQTKGALKKKEEEEELVKNCLTSTELFLSPLDVEVNSACPQCDSLIQCMTSVCRNLISRLYFELLAWFLSVTFHFRCSNDSCWPLAWLLDLRLLPADSVCQADCVCLPPSCGYPVVRKQGTGSLLINAVH